MSRGASELHFPKSFGATVGFASPTVDRERVTAETVVRELVQNSLDASSGSKAFVALRLESITLDKIPELETFKSKFEASKEFRKGQGGPPEHHAISRVDKCLAGEQVDVLVCTDHGKGIDETALRALYSQADTTKISSGRGSVGVGHLTAFAASDLRFVAYAGKHKDDGGALSSTFGGHAILATHRRGGTQYEPDGYILKYSRNLNDTPVMDAETVTAIPSCFEKWVPKARTGSAVAIYGYSPLKGPGQYRTVLESASAAVAKNFLVALFVGHLRLVCSDSKSKIEIASIVDLTKVINRGRSQLRRTGGQGVSGAVAFSALQTLRAGEKLLPAGGLDGTTIWFRRLGATEQTRISLFRDGMWISDSVPGLRRSDFGPNNPFEAVINVSAGDGEEFGTLVRNAEGASHLEVQPNSIESTSERSKLKQLIKRVAAILADKAGERQFEEIVPEQLRLFVGDLAAPVLRAKPPMRDIGNEPDLEISDGNEDDIDEGSLNPSPPGPGPGPNPDPDPPPGPEPGPGPGPHPSPKPRVRQAPRKGSTTGIKSACRIVDTKRLLIAWEAERFSAGAIGVRVMSPSGSDVTSESPERPRYLNIETLKFGDVAYEPDINQPDSLEVRIVEPPLAGVAEIELAHEPHESEIPFLRVEVVHRSS